MPHQSPLTSSPLLASYPGKKPTRARPRLGMDKTFAYSTKALEGLSRVLTPYLESTVSATANN